MTTIYTGTADQVDRIVPVLQLVRRNRPQVPSDGKRAAMSDDFNGVSAMNWVLDCLLTPGLADRLTAYAILFMEWGAGFQTTGDIGCREAPSGNVVI